MAASVGELHSLRLSAQDPAHFPRMPLWRRLAQRPQGFAQAVAPLRFALPPLAAPPLDQPKDIEEKKKKKSRPETRSQHPIRMIAASPWRETIAATSAGRGAFQLW